MGEIITLTTDSVGAALRVSRATTYGVRVFGISPMSDSSAAPTPSGPADLRSGQAACPTGLLTPAQARCYLQITNSQLLDLVRTARLRALRGPGGQLLFATADLEALPVGVAPEVAVAELNTNKEHMLDATMAAPEQVTSASHAAPGINLDVVMSTIEELRRLNGRAPQWVDIDAAVACYGVPAKMLKSWAGNGFVRKSKLGPTLQSKALYCAADINDCLCRIAAGKAPVNAVRKEAGA